MPLRWLMENIISQDLPRVGDVRPPQSGLSHLWPIFVARHGLSSERLTDESGQAPPSPALSASFAFLSPFGQIAGRPEFSSPTRDPATASGGFCMHGSHRQAYETVFP